MKVLDIYSLTICGLFWGAIANPAQGFTLDLFTDANDGFQEIEIKINNNTVSDFDIDTGLSGVAWNQRRLDITATSERRGDASITPLLQ